MVEALRRHRVAQFERHVALQGVCQANDLVISRDDGSPWPPNAFTHAFIDFLKARGLPTVRVHDLRPGYATQMLEERVPVEVVAELLGHVDAGFTLRTYGHVLPGQREDAASRMDRALRRAMGE